MKDGFLRVCAATPKIRVADCPYNASQIIACIDEAAKAGASLLVLPELCVTGYTCSDLFLQQTLLDGAVDALEEITKATSGKQLVVVVGVPLMHTDKLYNCAAVLYEGNILGIVPKTHLPSYSEYYERRQFTPAPQEMRSLLLFGQDVPFGTKLLFAARELPAFRLGVELCEDLWAADSPSTHHALAGATVLANPSAGDETIGKQDYRRALVAMQSAKLLAGYVYASAGDGESTTDMVFSGANFIAENGTVLAETKLFKNGMIVSELDVQKLAHERRRTTSFVNTSSEEYQTVWFSLPLRELHLTRPVDPHPFVPNDHGDRAKRCEQILAMQANGLKKRLEHTHAQTAVVGISGGLDSCLALLVMVRAMDLLGRPRRDVLAVTMPCFGTTRRTKSNAETLSLALGVTLQCVDIADAVNQHLKDLNHPKDVFDVTYENAQARERTQLLMDLANQANGMVIGTGDLSELALGWATYNGDHMSMYAVNASIPKTLVRHIVQYYADTTDSKEVRDVLLDILDTPVSPELLPSDGETISQQTEELVGPYELHDFFLYHILRFGYAPSKVFRLALLAFDGVYSRETILRWLKNFYRRFFAQQFKRSCLPDGPKVGSVTLSPRGDWRMPSDASAALWQSEADALQ